MSHPEHIPPLPPAPSNHDWPDTIHTAFHILSDVYNRSLKLLRSEDHDALHLQLYVEKMRRDLVPLLEALEREMEGHRWVIDVAKLIVDVGLDLEMAADAANNRDREAALRFNPITEVQTGQRGRPRKEIDPKILREAFSARRKISITRLATALGVNRKTLCDRLKRQGVYQRFSNITDLEIDVLIRHFRKDKPRSGVRYAIGFFHQLGIRIQKRRIREAIRRVSPVAQVLQQRASIQRREYRVARPNAVWHVDGHHKLIRWGIVIHGFIDGYSRLIVGLKASNNNRASTVFDLFLDSIQKHGIPSRVRGDRGGENIEVSVWMVMFRGPNRGSFLWGPSTRNVRIERTWGEAGSQFVRQWRTFFIRLEQLHRLDVTKPGHIWLIHILFLTEINEDCKNFQEMWNHHPISRVGHDQTPKDMFFLGQLEHGTYENADNLHPDTMKLYAPNSDSDQDAEAIEDLIANDQRNNVRHEPIEVPKHQLPFHNPEAVQIFLDALKEAAIEGIVPDDFGLREDEWEDGLYPEIEHLKVGKRVVEIMLPFEVWYPRAVVWARGLELMTRICLIEDGMQ